MTLGAALVVTAGAFAGGFVSGLTGFGTGIVALGLWLHVLEPVQAATLVAACSVTAQLQTLPAIWHALDGRRLAPMLLAGALGVPLGALLLTRADPAAFRLGCGILLVLFSAVMSTGRGRPAAGRGGRAADAAIGLGGGVLGGLAGLSGPLPTMWATLQGWSKDYRRGVFQGYNTAILVLTLAIHAAGGLVTREVGGLYLLALPGTILGVQAGLRVYRRLSDRGFDRVVVALLGLSGLALILANAGVR
ncbi:sulfite exporter TauE/SafE family protein [Methylobacterium sp. NEAU 140]|uniref:sulfite exporter TauE/SafE family protein n=1 Tax=Methylobacterium sp. NEAU 140 TaxID=3064945 RepID=UPI0027349616|nr:sulfite exporter TauE/SafE family protein [Methylobacterium sp. NEAU 140]MDP4025909.1 sulfite exporter TauE/SafE family protein [Methylobacterium sp. NEAU 140]